MDSIEMDPIAVSLPYLKVTPNSVVYGVAGRADPRWPVAHVYVKQKAMRDAGITGPWPARITVTVTLEEPE